MTTITLINTLAQRGVMCVSLPARTPYHQREKITENGLVIPMRKLVESNVGHTQATG